MKTILLIIATFVAANLSAQNIKPGVRSTFHAVDENGKPLDEELIRVEVTFSKDSNGVKVPVYVEQFTAKTTSDGYFQREIGATTGDLPDVMLGEFQKINFKDPNLCVRIKFKRLAIFNPQWIEGKWSKLNPVPVASEVISNDDADKDPQNEIQQLSKSGSTITLSNGGGTIQLHDDDPTNELQWLDYDEDNMLLYIEGGNTVDLSKLVQFMNNGSQLCTNKELQATRFITKNGHTDIEEGKVSLRYSNGFDGIEMGVDDKNGFPFITFIDISGDILGSIRMGFDGFRYYQD